VTSVRSAARLRLATGFCDGEHPRLAMCTGDMDLDPETGQYRFSAEVPLVEANALRETLGVRPLPQPLAGALRGALHITGPLEEPLFSGARPRCCCCCLQAGHPAWLWQCSPCRLQQCRRSAGMLHTRT
jgi:hypothetical protein